MLEVTRWHPVSDLPEKDLRIESERLSKLLRNGDATVQDAIRADEVEKAIRTIERVKSGR